MSDSLQIGLSALLANQAQLNATSQNISNVNTPGYSRQTVQLTAAGANGVSGGFAGSGVDVSAVSRNVDQFLTAQLQSSMSSAAAASTYESLASQVDALVSSGTFQPAITNFFSTLQSVNNDPASTTARTAFLSAAGTMTNQFKNMSTQLSQMNSEVNQGITQQISQFNTDATTLANLNQTIAQAYAATQGQTPNNLLDQRDQLLNQMSQLANITTLTAGNGVVNVSIGNGQSVVNGNGATPLVATTNVISNTITGGALGGLLSFRTQLLNPTHNSLGQLAAGLSETLNAQQALGIDLKGAAGTNLLSIGSPTVNAAATNQGTITAALDPTAVGNLTNDDYKLTSNGASFMLTDLTTGTQTSWNGVSPLSVAGMTLNVGTPPAAGDQYLIQPTRNLAMTMTTLITDPAKVAIAAPLKTSTSLSNAGNATISAPQVTNTASPGFATPTSIVFTTASTYSINGGAATPYVSGTTIAGSGWTVAISGAPAVGDTFQVGPNANAPGDNTNGLAMAALGTTGLLNGGTSTYQDTFSQMVGTVGSLAQQAQINSSALAAQQSNAQTTRDSISGVNMDEEAGNLVRYQQSYQAAAQLVQIASSTFRSLIQALGGA